MSVVDITSKEQFASLLSKSAIVVTDFYADWCGPCKAIAPAYDALATKLSRPDAITFTRINVDHQQELAQTYGVTAMPTFICFKDGRENKRVKGADPQQLNQIVRKLASEASQSDNAAGTGEGSSDGPWYGSTVAKEYSDITDQVDKKEIELLNRDTQHGEPRTLFDTSKPSGLTTKGKGKAEEQKKDWVESDIDQELMLLIPFQSSSNRVHSIQITSLPPDANENEEETPMRPKTLKIWKNEANVLGFDSASNSKPTQKVEIQHEDWDEKTGTATVVLRFVLFQNVSSLNLFFVDGDGNGEKLRLDRIRIIGEAGANRNMGKLEKIGDEPGE